MKSKLDDVLVLSEKESDKMAYKEAIESTLGMILSSINSQMAYTGKDAFSLRKEIERLDTFPERGIGWEKIKEEISEHILPNMLQTWSPYYMPHLHSPALVESIAAELIVSTYNSSMDSWDQGPVMTELEVKVIKDLAKLFGYENGDGVFTSGGSQSNITASIIARDKFLAGLGVDAKEDGISPYADRLRMYVSEISHFSFDKASSVMGLGSKAVVKLPVNEKMQINIEKAEKIIRKDKEDGLMPFLLTGTIGTTDYGSIDDIEKLKEIADRYGLFLHADAAYGSGAILSSYRERLGKLDLADSITVDFHKMFLLPISASVLLVRNEELFSPFLLHADYLNREEDEKEGFINLVGKSLQTTRRSDAFKAYVTFRMRGQDGMKKVMDKVIGNASYLYSALLKNGNFLVPVEPALSSVVFAVKDGEEVNRRLRKALLKKGLVIGETKKDGKTMLKATLLNPNLEEKHLDELIDLILKEKDEIRKNLA